MGKIVPHADRNSRSGDRQEGVSWPAVRSGIRRIDLLTEGVQAYHTDLINDSLAAQRVEVCVITFGGQVQTLVPFVVASEFVPPTLEANGETPMGAAIVHAIQAIEDRKQLYRRNGLHYYRPWIFLITDGEPTDNWEIAALKIREGEQQRKFAFFAVGVEGANFTILRQLCVREPLPLKGYSFREMFVWLSQSQRQVSHSNPGQEGHLKLPSPAGWASI